MFVTESDDARLDFERASVTSSDLELEPVTSEGDDYTSAPADYQISAYPADFTLEVLHQKWLSEDFNIPDFQRGFVWKLAQSSKLIESFLVGLPVPPVFVYTERESQKLLVIDGQQRLKSIFYFLEGYFSEDARGNRKVFQLIGLNESSRFAGKTFADLGGADQRRFKNSVLRAFVVQQIDPDDDTSMYHIFERLNTGGTLLANQEIRNCVYGGSFVKSLARLNQNPEWRKILGKPTEDSRKRDIELLVRFFALRDISDYRRPMKDFLSRFMVKNRYAYPEVLAQSEWVFQTTCTQVLKALGEKPFHLRSALNVAALDAVMVAFSENLERIPSDINARYDDLKRDQTFLNGISGGTTEANVVRDRIEKAKTVLFG